MFTVEDDVNDEEVSKVFILGTMDVSFRSRPAGTTVLELTIGDIEGSTESTVVIIARTQVRITGYQGKLILRTDLTLNEDGKLIGTDQVIIEKGFEFTWCGSISGVSDLVVRSEGKLIGGYPANSFGSSKGIAELSNLIVEDSGVVQGATCPDQGSTQVKLKLDAFKRVSGISLDSNYFVVQEGDTETISASAAELTEEMCNETAEFLHIQRAQTCRLAAKVHTYEYIIIETGASITLDGDPEGMNQTILNVQYLYIRTGGIMDGAGTGYKSGGTGEGSAGSYGGLGNGITDVNKLYGSVETPDHYGSNAVGASDSNGRGGGYIKIIASNYVQIGKWLETPMA